MDEAPPNGSNDLSDEQKSSLFVQGLEQLEWMIAEKDEIVAKIRNQRKVMKSEGFTRDEVDHALKMRGLGDAAPAFAQSEIEMRVRIAAWLGKPLGHQSALDV